jgi:hypothetical protein
MIIQYDPFLVSSNVEKCITCPALAITGTKSSYSFKETLLTRDAVYITGAGFFEDAVGSFRWG